MKNYFLLSISLASFAAYGSWEHDPFPGGSAGVEDQPDLLCLEDEELASYINFSSPILSTPILSTPIFSLIREYSDQAAVPARGVKRKAQEEPVQNSPEGANNSAALSELPAPKRARPKPFKCERGRCNKSFASKSDLEYHARVHVGEKPFECVMCGRRFRQRSALTVHLRVHSGYKPFKCKSGDCGREFSDNANLIRHQLVHTGERRFECGQCPLKFAQKGNLKTHQQVHSGEKPFECPDCGKCFRRKTQLQGHVQSNMCREDAEPQEPVELPTPKKQEDKLFVCDVGECKKPFSRAGHLENHKRVHSGERRFECDQCPRKFAQTGNLKAHQRVHSGEKPFKCPDCEKCFRKEEHLQDHGRVHSGERPYPCEDADCGKAFSQRSNLKVHMRLHTGEKPYTCPTCSKGFAQKGGLHNHIKKDSCSGDSQAADALALLAQDGQAE